MVEINGTEYEVKVGSVIMKDSKGILAEKLMPGDDYVDSGYPGSKFRIPTPQLEPVIKSLPVNVTITGRSLRRLQGTYWIRVSIEWVGDCEPSTFTGGWVLAETAR